MNGGDVSSPSGRTLPGSTDHQAINRAIHGCVDLLIIEPRWIQPGCSSGLCKRHCPRRRSYRPDLLAREQLPYLLSEEPEHFILLLSSHPDYPYSQPINGVPWAQTSSSTHDIACPGGTAQWLAGRGWSTCRAGRGFLPRPGLRATRVLMSVGLASRYTHAPQHCVIILALFFRLLISQSDQIWRAWFSLMLVERYSVVTLCWLESIKH